MVAVVSGEIWKTLSTISSSEFGEVDTLAQQRGPFDVLALLVAASSQRTVENAYRPVNSRHDNDRVGHLLPLALGRGARHPWCWFGAAKHTQQPAVKK